MAVDTISNDDPGAGLPLGRRPEADRPLRSGARATALTTAVSLVLVGGVVTAAVRGAGNGTAPDTLAPASTFAFAQVDLSLADGQDSALTAFLGHFPDAPTNKAGGSLRDRILRAALRDSSDPHVDYAKDVRPWLGNRAAAGGWIDASGKPRAEFLLRSTDDKAARASLHRLAPRLGVAFAHGYVVLAESQQLADAAVSAARKSSLGNDTGYRGDVGRLTGPQIVTGWVDAAGAGRAMQAGMHGMNPFSMLPGAGLLAPHALGGLKGRAVIGLHVTKTYAELVAQTIGAGSPSAGAEVASSDLLSGLPDGTIGAVELASPGRIVTAAMSLATMFFGVRSSFSVSSAPGIAAAPARGGSGAYNSTLQFCPTGGTCTATPIGPAPRGPSAQARSNGQQRPATNPAQEIEKATGLSLPGDATTLLGSAAVISYGGLHGHGLPNVALRSRPADAAKARALAEHSREVVARGSGIGLAVARAADDLIVATNADYAAAVAAGGHLGAQTRFAQAMGTLPKSVGFAAYVDLADVLPLLSHGRQPDVDHLDALGMWSGRVGDGDRLQLRLVVH